MDLWVYSLTIFGNCGVDELPTANGDSNVEAVVWPWINVVLFDALPLIFACCVVVPLAIAARRFSRSASVVVSSTEDPMAMIYAAFGDLTSSPQYIIMTKLWTVCVKSSYIYPNNNRNHFIDAAL